MIFIWNRKEIYKGTSSQRFIQIRNILCENEIKYTDRIVNRYSSSIMEPLRSYTNTFGEDLNYTYTYYIYVSKDNYDLVNHLISRID